MRGLIKLKIKDPFIRVKVQGYSIGLVAGINWLHRRPSNLMPYLKKTYLRGKRRISFIEKYKRWSELLRDLLPFWILVTTLVLSFFYPILLAPIVAGLGGGEDGDQ